MNTADTRFTIEQIENRLNGVQCMAGAVSDAMENSPSSAEDYSDAVWLIGELLRESQKELGKVLDSLMEMQQESAKEEN